MGAYEGLRALADLAGRDSAALAYARDVQSHAAVADCLSATTTRWLPVYGAGAAVAAGLATWLFDGFRVRNPPRQG
jgi:hypothetical protein